MGTIVFRHCRKCGAKIFGRAKVCGACLLESALDSGDDDVDPMEFGDYELLEEVGRGGQGVVYRARQKSLNRTVALKVIALGHFASKPHLKRFRHEAEAAASLEHPQIVPIYEVGERDGSCYFSMKFIEGGQLDEMLKSATPDSSRGEREPMSIRRAAELLVKIARTVQFAHEHGILHRDIKPGNILIDKNGEPHLTDFGLARLVEQQSTVTNSFDVLGTPSYMSPEQAAGQTKELTPAADVYGVGAVFYQMLTGKAPFAGGTTYETIRLVLETEPKNPRLRNPKVDVDLATICLKCLDKDPLRRYPAAGALAQDVERWLRHEPIHARRTGAFTRSRKWIRRNPVLAVSVPTIAALVAAIIAIFWQNASRDVTPLHQIPAKSVAVLPFVSVGADEANAMLADGIQDEILRDLTKVADLKVISRTSVMRYKTGARNLREIARALGVAHVLEGSVQRAGDGVRVTAQLINARDDTHLWADKYDRKVTDMFSVESEIATRIAETLQARLTGAEKQAISSHPTENSEAYQLYRKGRYFWGKRGAGLPGSAADIEKALGYFNQAVAKDNRYALAYTGLADCYLVLPIYRGLPHMEFHAQAMAAAKKALEIDDNVGEAHASFANLLLRENFHQAKREFLRAIELSPNYATAHQWFGGYVLIASGEFDRGIGEAKRAVELDPFSITVNNALGWNYVMARRYPEAIIQFRKTIELDPTAAGPHWNLGKPLELTGQFEEAVSEYEKGSEVGKKFSLAYLAHLYAAKGDRDKALEMFGQLQALERNGTVWALGFAIAHVGLGNKDQAIDWLERSYREKDPNSFFIKVDPFFDPLRGDPRFEKLVTEVIPPEQVN